MNPRFIKSILLSAVIFPLITAGLAAQAPVFTPFNITCTDAADGKMKIDVAGGSSYRYVCLNLYDLAKSDSFGPTTQVSYTFQNRLPDTDYIFLVRDLNTGLIAGLQSYIYTNPLPLNATVGGTHNISCYGSLTGSIIISGTTGGSGQFDYTINAGASWQNTGSYNSLAAGTYRVWIRDRINPGCIKILNDALQITQNPPLSATVTATNPLCFGLKGSITISNPTGGSPSGNYQYRLNSGTWSTTTSYPNLNPGSYAIEMRKSDIPGCVASLGTVTISQPTQLTVNISINKGLTCFEGSDGRLQANVNGGTTPYSYQWEKLNGSIFESIGQTTQIANNLNQGRYRVTVIDANGCTTSPGDIQFIRGALPVGIRDSIPPMFYYDGAVATSTCQGQTNGSIDLSAHGGVKPYRFSITTGGASGYQPDSLFKNLGAGTYQPWIMDKRGCKKTGADVIVASTPNDPVSVSVTANPSGNICPGTSVMFTATPVNGGTTPAYQWRVNGAAVGTSQPTYSSATLANGDQVNVVLTSNLRCTSGNPATSNTITIAHNPVTAITVQPVPVTQCEGTNATFSVTATGNNRTYQWRKNGIDIPGANSAAYTINNINSTHAGNYSVRVHSDCGTDVTSNNALLTVNPATAIVTQPQSVAQCVGTNVTFTVVANGTSLTYQWRKDGVDIPGASSASYTINNIAAGNAGSYSVRIHGNCGADVISNNAVLTVNPATLITVQPVAVTQCEGTDVSFSVTATGTNLRYQWRKNGSDITGATSSTYTINSIIPGDAGNYSVAVTGDCGPVVVSNNALLTVNPATSITTQPQPVTQCAGTNATFTVVAQGTVLTYQWMKEGVNIPGANSASYTINNINSTHAGNYSVRVHGNCGADAISNAVALTVNPLTEITAQPAPVTQCAGTSASFSVTAKGTSLTYQWMKNGTDIAGATSATYTVNNINDTHAGNYSVRVHGNCGADVISNNALLTVNPLTAITVQPAPQVVCEGGTATFQVTAAGNGLSYQWRKNGTAIPGATGDTYTILTVSEGDEGSYSVVVTGNCGPAVTSTAVALTVNPLTAITTQPSALLQCAGTTATFTVVATGTSLTYQWMKDGTDISGATSATYTINNINTTHTGNYSVRVHGSCGPDVISANASLSLHPSTAIIQQPAGATVCPGDNYTFTADADGTGLTYQWKKNGTNIPGANGTSYTIPNISSADAGNYSVTVTGTCGTVNSDNAVLTVNSVPAITTQPKSITLCAGADHTFTVAASGDGLTYLWRKDGSPLVPAQTGTSLILTGIDAGDAGSYDVVITNSCGDITSDPAVLTVAETPAITSQPSDIEICEGNDITFSVIATGTNITYQWRKDGNNIAGATSSDLILSSVSPSANGEYDVVITGLCGTITSDKAVLTVNPATSGVIDEGDVIVCAGDVVEFNVTAEGSGSLFYQWQKYTGGMWADLWDDGKYSGTFSPSLEIDNVEMADTGLFRVQVSGDCGSIYTEPVRLDVNDLIATIGTPAPFLINSETTKIEVSFTVEGRYLVHDLGFALVAPDGTEVILKSPLIDVCGGNYSNPVNVDATFTNLPASLPGIDYCTPMFQITGTFGSEGDWSVLNGKDPANGAWQVRVYDNTRYFSDTDGVLTSASLTFTDLDTDGNTRVITYNSGAISIDIMDPVVLGENRATSFIAPIRLMTSCFNTEDAKAVVTVKGGIPPYSYEWSGPTPESGDEADLGVGTYTVTVTDAIGCISEATVEVTAPPAIMFENVKHTDTIACFEAADGVIRARATGGSGSLVYTLLPGDIASSVADSGVFTGLTAGTYTLRATDLNGCMLDTVITISENQAIVLNILTVPVIGDEKGSITITATGGVAPYQYSIDNGTTFENDGDFTDLDAGIYQVYVVDAAGCIALAEVNLNVELLNVDVTVHDVSCYGLADGSFYLALVDGTGPYTLTGSFTDTLVLASGAFSFTGQTAGTYDVKIEDSEGRVFIDNIVISEPVAITATGVITNATCSAITEDGAVDVTVAGGSGVYTFDWSNGATTEDLAAVEAGTYQVVISDENDCNSESFEFIVVGLNQATAYAGENDTICPGTEYQLFGSPVADSVRWEPAILLDDATSFNPTATIETLTPFVYTVYDNGCFDRDTVTIDVFERIGMDIYDPSGSQPSIGDSIYMLEGETAFMAATPGFSSYRWEPIEGLSDPNAEAVTVNPSGTTFYTVFGTTDKGCIESDMVKVVIARKIIIFTGFSPNGDEYNQTWTIQNAYQYGDRIRVRVFNRWGEPVFESKGYSVEWDGTRNGRPLPVGAYYYIIDVKDGKSEPYTGTVTILR